jgi:hypothetical protein
MTRITCRTPSTGRPVRAAIINVPTSFITIANAPDFSVPDTSSKFASRDPVDITRAIKPGEIFFLTPLSVTNKDIVNWWIEVQLLTEAGIIIAFGKVTIPAGDTAYIPLQGRSLFKRDVNTSIGDQLQIRAESADKLDVWASAEEKLSNEHSGVV